MIDNSRKELEQLEKLLSMDEEWFQRELDPAKRMIGQNPNQPAPASRKPASVNAPVRNYGGGTGRPAPQAVKTAEAPASKGIRGLLILAILEAMGILGLAAYWALVLLR